MKFSIAAALTLLASSAIASPAEVVEKRDPKQVVKYVYKYVKAAPKPAQYNGPVVFTTCYVDQYGHTIKPTKPTPVPYKHHHGKPGGYKVYTSVVVIGGKPAGGYTKPKPTKAPAPPSYGSPAPAPSYGNNAPAGWESQVLALHNSLRAKHGAPPLVWDTGLVNSCNAPGYQCLFQHHPQGNGECLAKGYGSATAAVQGWYDEVSQYNYGSGGFSMSTGHFTQVVWKSSQRLGCTLNSCGGSPQLRCQYSPPGNYAGRFQQNVLPPSYGGYGKN